MGNCTVRPYSVARYLTDEVCQFKRMLHGVAEMEANSNSPPIVKYGSASIILMSTLWIAFILLHKMDTHYSTRPPPGVSCLSKVDGFFKTSSTCTACNRGVLHAPWRTIWTSLGIYTILNTMLNNATANRSYIYLYILYYIYKLPPGHSLCCHFVTAGSWEKRFDNFS